MNILVAYATTAGSTKEVAETVAEVITSTGHTATAVAVENVESLGGYDAVVLGSSVRAFGLIPKTKRFLRKFKKTIREMPFAIFLVCLVMSQDTPERVSTAMKFARPMIKVKEPVSIGLFGGVMDASKLTGYAYGMFKNRPYEDNRNWDNIKTWASELPTKLGK